MKPVTRVGLGTCTLNPIGEWICESACEPGPMARIQEGDKKMRLSASKSRRPLVQFEFGLERMPFFSVLYIVLDSYLSWGLFMKNNVRLSRI
jgi:hypothetical protein